MSFFQYLDLDILFEIIIKLPSSDIYNICRINKFYSSNICENNEFWRLKFNHDFKKDNIYIDIENSDSWKLKYKNFPLYGLKLNKYYSPLKLIPLIQKLLKNEIIIYDSDNNIFGIIEDFKKTFPLSRFINENVEEIEEEGIKFLYFTPFYKEEEFLDEKNKFIIGKTLILSTPETREYFLSPKNK